MLRPILLSFLLTLPAAAQDLARHDFLYAGEAKDRRVFIYRGGHQTWSYALPDTRGEISDAVLLSNGTVLLAHQFGTTLVSPEKQILWHFDVPDKDEVHTAVPIGLDRVLYIMNGDPALLRVVNIRTNAVERELTLHPGKPASTHGQFRHARLTSNGTLLVAHLDAGKVVEYDATGKELWSFPGTGLWGVTPLPSGNVLLTDRLGIREITRRGDTAWSFTPATDAPSLKFSNLQNAYRLPNGNTVLNNWQNQWNPGTPGPEALQAVEITPTKQVVWALHSWSAPNDLGPATTIQFLDPGSDLHPESAHFGDIH